MAPRFNLFVLLFYIFILIKPTVRTAQHNSFNIILSPVNKNNTKGTCREFITCINLGGKRQYATVLRRFFDVSRPILASPRRFDHNRSIPIEIP